MAQYELTDNMIKNLATFLGRVMLHGNEVSAFNELCQALSVKKDSEVTKKPVTDTDK